MKLKIEKTPLLVVVTDHEWNAFGDLKNIWHRYLIKALNKMGGVNESVAPGDYEFNVHREGLNMIATLLPVKK